GAAHARGVIGRAEAVILEPPQPQAGCQQQHCCKAGIFDAPSPRDLPHLPAVRSKPGRHPAPFSADRVAQRHRFGCAPHDCSLGPMTYLVTSLFGLAYVGMALGRIPGLRIDRSGIAMIIAVLLVAIGAIPMDRIAGAIHFPTLLLLAGLMVL